MQHLLRDHEEMAQTYHEGRPGYPSSLFVDAQRQCRITPECRILEIGAGSGLSTVGLANLGAHLTALEPSEAFAKLVHQHTRNFNNIEIINTDFSHYTLKNQFRAAFAFMSFHWVKDSDKFDRLAQMIEDDGSLVIVWQYFLQQRSPTMDEVNRILSAEFNSPYKTSKHNNDQLRLLNKRDDELMANDLFYVDGFKSYINTLELPPDSYCSLLKTFSDVEDLPHEKRQGLFDKIRPIVSASHTLPVPVLTDMIICKKQAGMETSQPRIDEAWVSRKKKARKNSLARLLGNGGCPSLIQG